MKRIGQSKPDQVLSAEKALFLALEDPPTAYFLRTAFAIPEQRPEIMTERWVTKDKFCYFWQVAIIEKPRPALRGNPPLLNIAHVTVDALDGKISQRWFLRSVFYEEYQEFMKSLFSLHEGCKDHSR